MKRLASIDALRGFDMSFIMGVDALVIGIGVLIGIPNFEELFDHARWHGLHFMDCVFPTFLFIAGFIPSTQLYPWGRTMITVIPKKPRWIHFLKMTV